MQLKYLTCHLRKACSSSYSTGCLALQAGCKADWRIGEQATRMVVNARGMRGMNTQSFEVDQCWCIEYRNITSINANNPSHQSQKQTP